MQVFISHASTDSKLAMRVAAVLNKAGMQAWDGSQIFPGDNWGDALAEALRKSDAMVVLLTPDALRSPNISLEIGYALGNKNYKGRVLSVVAAPADQVPKDQIPWILNRFQMIYLNDLEKDDLGLQEIAQALLQAAA